MDALCSATRLSHVAVHSHRKPEPRRAPHRQRSDGLLLSKQKVTNAARLPQRTLWSLLPSVRARASGLRTRVAVRCNGSGGEHACLGEQTSWSPAAARQESVSAGIAASADAAAATAVCKQMLRRTALLSLVALPAVALPPSSRAEPTASDTSITTADPSFALSSSPPSQTSLDTELLSEKIISPAKPGKPSPDTTITQRVYLDFSLCPTAIRLERTLGDMSLICSDGEPLGRVVIGLYGHLVPTTVQHFVDMVTGRAGSTYKGSIIHRSLPGQYIMGGKQGAVEKGEVSPPTQLQRNPETIDSRSFQLPHLRPGTVSLSLSENDDEDDRRLGSDYRNVQFLITTGPGPAPQLDNGNIVFGRVLEGMNVITAIASVPTYQPNEQIRQFNELAEFLGDERAAKGRTIWNRPLKAIVISDCGVVDVTPPPPLLPPSLP